MGKRAYTNGYRLSMAYRIGPHDRAYQERAWDLVQLKSDMRLDGMRIDPRFAALLKRIGLPASARFITLSHAATTPRASFSRIVPASKAAQAVPHPHVHAMI